MKITKKIKNSFVRAPSDNNSFPLCRELPKKDLQTSVRRNLHKNPNHTLVFFLHVIFYGFYHGIHHFSAPFGRNIFPFFSNHLKQSQIKGLETKTPNTSVFSGINQTTQPFWLNKKTGHVDDHSTLCH